MTDPPSPPAPTDPGQTIVSESAFAIAGALAPAAGSLAALIDQAS